MKLAMKSDLLVLKAIEEQGKDNKSYYRISVFDSSSGEAGVLNCTELVAKDVKVNEINSLIVEFNDKYNSIRAISVEKPKK